MIELILALASSSMLATAVVGNMAETERFSTSGQNQLMAAAVGQEIIDNVRNMRFERLAELAPGSPYTFLVNRNGFSQVGPPVIQRALLLDLVSLDWSQAAAANRFTGEATCSIVQDQVFADMLRAVVEVNWTEGQQERHYRVETLIAEHGIHN